MSPALHAVKLRQLWSKFSESIYPGLLHANNNASSQQIGASIESLRRELEDWKATIPEDAPGDSSNGQALSVFASKNWFRLAYDYSILLLYRHYITDSQGGGGNQESRSPAHVGITDARDRAFEICANHARDICSIYRHLYQTQGAHVQFTWGSLHILFLAGLTYLYCLWRSPYVRLRTRPTTVMNTSMACTTVLIIIADRWPSAISYRDIFETLSERTISMMCGENGDSSRDVGVFPPADGAGVAAMQPPPGANEGDAFQGFSGAMGADFVNFRGENGMLPMQDWITALDDIEAPGNSQWLAQELFQGLLGDSSFLV